MRPAELLASYQYARFLANLRVVVQMWTWTEMVARDAYAEGKFDGAMEGT